MLNNNENNTKMQTNNCVSCQEGRCHESTRPSFYLLFVQPIVTVHNSVANWTPFEATSVGADKFSNSAAFVSSEQTTCKLETKLHLKEALPPSRSCLMETYTMVVAYRAWSLSKCWRNSYFHKQMQRNLLVVSEKWWSHVSRWLFTVKKKTNKIMLKKTTFDWIWGKT